MGFSYTYQGSSTFLTYTVEPDDRIDSVTLGMLTNNKMKGIAPMLYTQMDEVRYVKYNVSGRITAKNYFSGTVSRRQLLGVLRGLIDAMRAAEDYMFDSESILLDMDYIFIDITTCDALYICVPIEGLSDAGKTMREFVRDVLFQIRYDQGENCDYVAKLINYLNSTTQVHLDGFNVLLSSLENECVSSPVPSVQKSEKHSSVLPIVKPVAAPALPQVAPGQQSPVPQQTDIHPVFNGKQQTSRLSQATKDGKAGGNTEKAMSIWYLLNHFSKENLALYRMQRGGTSEKAGKKGREPSQTSSASAPPFAIPGQEIPMETSSQPMPVDRMSAAEQQNLAPAYNNSHQIPRKTPDSATPQKSAGTEQLNFGETVYFPKESDETVLIKQSGKTKQPGETARLTPRLVRKMTNEQILITKDFFRIGRDTKFNDYAILDNLCVGHTHCHILMKDGEYFLVDDNSKNRTMVNGEIVLPGTKAKLAHGDSISVADEEYEFRLF